MEAGSGIAWVDKFIESRSMGCLHDSDIIISGKDLVEFIEKESNGTFRFDEDYDCLVQMIDVSWQDVFDVVKANSGYGYGNIVRQPLPPEFKINYDQEDINPGMMYAVYDKHTDAVRLYIYTGIESTIPMAPATSESNIEESSGVNDNGFHVKVIHLSSRPIVELESIEGIRDRNGIWLQGLHSAWG